MQDVETIEASRALDTTKRYEVTQLLQMKQDGEEVLAMIPEALELYQFNSSLARIVARCDGKTTCEDLVIDFVETYGLDVEEAAREVYRGLTLLNQHNLIKPVSDGA